MGIAIGGPDEGPYPRPTYMRLACDAKRSLLCTPFETDVGFLRGMTAATACGWKESPTGFFHCPACSGK